MQPPHPFDTSWLDKKIKLMKVMMLETSCQDAELIQDLTNGFALTGYLQLSGPLPARLKPTSISEQYLRKASAWAKHSVDARAFSVLQDPELAEAVSEETLKQADPAKGWLSGPFLAFELDAKYQGRGVASRSFGVLQGSKVRAVDDFNEFGVNSALTSIEKLPLGCPDELIALARAMVSAVHDDRSTVFQLSTGQFFTDTLHEEWTNKEARDELGRTLHLEAAYKQLARKNKDTDVSIIAVASPRAGCTEFFEVVALPFETTGAVTAFERAARL
jgi:hypothetical protein